MSRSSEIVGEFAGAKSELGPAWTRLLEAVAQGHDAEARALAVCLAHEVLSSPASVLAHAVLAGGPHAMSKAVELAELLLDSPPPIARGAFDDSKGAVMSGRSPSSDRAGDGDVVARSVPTFGSRRKYFFRVDVLTVGGLVRYLVL